MLTEEAIAVIRKHATDVIEIGAGSGYCAWLMHGFGVSRTGQNQLLIQTVSGADYGFINNGWAVFGVTLNRIGGGGVFEIVSPGGSTYFETVNFHSPTVESPIRSWKPVHWRSACRCKRWHI